MQFLNYFLASAISFLGLLIGILLVKIAPEEQKPLGKYMVAAKKILMVLIFAFLILYYFKNQIYLSVLAACFLIMLFLEYKIKDLFRKSVFSYFMLGILFFLSFKNKNLFVIESGLILLYGMTAASIIYNKKNHYRIIAYHLIFVIAASILYFTTSHFLS